MMVTKELFEAFRKKIAASYDSSKGFKGVLTFSGGLLVQLPITCIGGVQGRNLCLSRLRFGKNTRTKYSNVFF